MKNGIRRLKKISLSFIYFLSLFSAICIFYDTEAFLFNIFRSFASQYIILYLCLALFFLLVKRRIIGLAYLALAIFSFAFITFRTIGFSNKNKSGALGSYKEQLNILQFNIMHHNSNIKKLFQTIDSLNIDLLCIVEADKSTTEAIIDQLSTEYPYYKATKEYLDYNMLVMSRFRFSEDSIYLFPMKDRLVPFISAKLHIGNSIVDLFCLHFPPPLSKEGLFLRNRQIEAISEFASVSENEKLIIGDFNVVPWSYEIKDFKSRLKLKDGRKRLLPTYPSDRTYISFPIDYIFVTDGFQIVAVESLYFPGSDHKGLFGKYNYKHQSISREDVNSN